MNQEISEDLRGLFASLMHGLGPSAGCVCGKCNKQKIELFAGPTEVIRFRETFCTEAKSIRIVLSATADGEFVISIQFFSENEKEGSKDAVLNLTSPVQVCRLVRSLYRVSLLSIDTLSAVHAALSGDQSAVQWLQERGTDIASFPSVQDITDDLVTALERCRANDIDIDTADVTAAIRSGELTISEETLRRLQIETPAEEDTRLEREAKVARRVKKTFRKFARHTRPDNEDQIVKGLTTLAIDLDRTGRIDDEQELIATCLYLTALGISSVAELNDVPSAQMAEALEAGGVALDKTKAFVERRFKRNEFLCDTVEGTLRWWDVETSEEEVEDQEPALAGSDN